MATKLVFEGDLGNSLRVDAATSKVEVSVDGTTIGLNQMGQLESLGGTGAPEETFIASGTIPSGAVVALRSDGQVEVVSAPFAPVEQLVAQGGPQWPMVTALDPDKIVVAYIASSSVGQVVVGTVVNDTITFGPVVSFGSSVDNLSIATTSNAGFGIAYNQGATILYLTGTVSGDPAVVTLGTPEIVTTVPWGPAGVKLSSGYNGPVVVVEAAGTVTAFAGAGWTPLIVGSGSGGDNTIGVVGNYWPYFNDVAVAWTSGSTVHLSVLNHDSGNLTLVATYAIPGLVGSSQLGIGATPSGFVVASRDRAAHVRWDPWANYLTSDAAPQFTGVDAININAVYDPYSSRVLLTYRHGVTATMNVAVGTIGFESIKFEGSSELSPNEMAFGDTVYHTSLGKLFTSFRTIGTSNNAVVVMSNPGMADQAPKLADSWVGIAKHAAADQELVAVSVDGETATNLSGLSSGGHYYVEDSGSLTTTPNGRFIGRAHSSTSLRIIGSGKLSNTGVFD